MKYTLKDYQTDAVTDLLDDLTVARKLWVRDKKPSSVSLTAPTGAGKTVMAAAVIEALFHGSQEYDFDPDPTAVVVWFCDDPNLNDQTRNRLLAASEQLGFGDLVTIKPPFVKRTLDAGKVYFLNTQRLSSSSLLTRGHDVTDERLPGMGSSAPPDLQDYTIWETISNTITDQNRTLYLVLDEAHRGFNARTSREKPTIVRRLVAGHDGNPPVPIVLGISATIERFQAAMAVAESETSRRQFRPVVVDPGRVQESGLIKDVVSVKFPDESGLFDTSLVKLGAKELVESTERWADYAAKQRIEPVVPLLVLQVPNKPTSDTGEWAGRIGLALDAIAEVYPGLTPSMVRNVLGENRTEQFGGWPVAYIEPQRVEDNKAVRVLIAKDAISTGWDCPRAEVLVSFRPAQDNTHITQLLGRMVRNPLARRVPGDERFNSVECILPFFDKRTAGNVVRYLTGQLDEMPGSQKKVLVDGRALVPNPNIDAKVWEVWDSLPSQTLPKRAARPVKRLAALAHLLSQDNVRPGALADATREMIRVLDAGAARHPDLLDREADAIATVSVKEISGKRGSRNLRYRDLAIYADDRAIRSQFVVAKKAFGGDIAGAYVDYIANDDEFGDDGLRDAYVKVAALASVKEVREQFDQEATALANKWFAQHRVDIKALTDSQQAKYEEIRGMAVEPQMSVIGRPLSRLEDFAERASAADELELDNPAPLVPLHLMSDDSPEGKHPGMFPLSGLNNWERRVVNYELEQKPVVGWYRNLPRSATDSFSIAYRDDDGDWRSLFPDFIFFHNIGGEVKPSIIDPHWFDLPNSSAKLRALAKFAADYGNLFHRVEAVAEVESGTMRVLDFTIPAVREAVLHGVNPPVEFYRNVGLLYGVPITVDFSASRIADDQ